ncbi:hypothetical protein R1sor_026103 [Riccia sorocarpa]|uniref:TFIIS N-terminal domain-containing protein n=1 Tax=Riccia sorocarpa TaxID=122646 RepID=A0ABD3GAI5_9MARC
MVDKLKSLSSKSVEYESEILTRFLNHSSIRKALKVGSIMSLKEQHTAKLLLANLSNGLQTIKRTHTQDDMIAKRCVVKWTSHCTSGTHKPGGPSYTDTSATPSNLLSASPVDRRRPSPGGIFCPNPDGFPNSSWVVPFIPQAPVPAMLVAPVNPPVAAPAAIEGYVHAPPHAGHSRSSRSWTHKDQDASLEDWSTEDGEKLRRHWTVGMI